MWCDNCLLVLPLRAGAIALALLIAAYSIGGGIFLFLYGPLLFFVYPEWQIYGGIGLGVGFTAIISMFALSNRTFIWITVAKFMWPFVIIISAIRAILMIVELQRGQYKVLWECSNGGQQWTAPNVIPPTTTRLLPTPFCTYGFASVNTAFIISLLVDIVLQIYMYFLTWRYSKRLEHYSSLKGRGEGGVYYS
ncbi:hypothetical protein BYT27DRAFT_7190042 [Phlegmacium glaucopus]|nr:hypothetical protein BYT27DRAFT_7190042 [Phlegmacium glaucopus]